MSDHTDLTKVMAEGGALTCDTCEKNTSVGVGSVPFIPMSMAYCDACLQANAHPWWALVAAASACGGREECNEQFQKMIQDTCTHLNKTIQQFDMEVETEIREAQANGW